MLTLYLIALVIGGTLLGVSLFFGGDGDADVDAHADFDSDAGADFDADADADADADHDVGLDAAAVWLPFASIRFWIFFLAFFGLAGTLLSTVGGMSSQIVVGGASAGTGYFCGVGASAVVKWLMRNEADSSIRARDLVGARGEVLLPVRAGGAGKVRLSLRGQLLDYRATTEDDVEYEIGSTVMVYDSRDDGELVVTKADEA